MTLTFNNPLVLGKKAVFNPDVFTVIGSPSITAEGIASNFSVSNYIRLPEIVVTGADFEVDLGRVTMPELGHGFQMLTGGNDISHSFIIALQGNTNILYFGSNQRIFRTIITDIAVSEGEVYRIKAGREDGTYYLDAALEGGNYTRYESSGILSILNELRLNIGSSADADRQYCWRGSYDLKQLKITADGQEVFSGSKLITPEWEAKPFKFDVKSINMQAEPVDGLSFMRVQGLASAPADELNDITFVSEAQEMTKQQKQLQDVN